MTSTEITTPLTRTHISTTSPHSRGSGTHVADGVNDGDDADASSRHLVDHRVYVPAGAVAGRPRQRRSRPRSTAAHHSLRGDRAASPTPEPAPPHHSR